MRKFFLIAILCLSFCVCGCSARGTRDFRVRFYTYGGTIIPDAAVSELRELPVPEKEGCLFEGWYENENFEGRRIIAPFSPAEDVILYARYTDIKRGNEEFAYELSEDGTSYEVSGFSGNTENAVIPPEYEKLPVTAIREGAFDGAYLLKKLYFWGNLEKIDEKLYLYSNFEEYALLEENKHFSVKNGVLYSSDEKVLLSVPPAQKGARGTFTVPDGVTVLSKNAFKGCVFLTRIEINSALEKIECAFAGLKNLSAFVSKSERFPADGYGALYAAAEDGKILLAVPPKAPSGEYKVSDGTVEIGDGSLENASITVLLLPESLEKFGTVARMDNLKNISVADGNPVYRSENGVLYTADRRLVKFPSALETSDVRTDTEKILPFAFYNCSVAEVTLPDALKIIESNAFIGGADKNVCIGKNSALEKIESGAFADIRKLKLTLSPARPPLICEESFSDVEELEIRVPGNLIALYKYLYPYFGDNFTDDVDDVPEYEIRYDSAGGSMIESVRGAFCKEEPRPSRDGYIFSGWYDNPSCTGERIEFPYVPEKDAVLYAWWEEKP